MSPCYRDKTYCASTNCENKCGRKMSEQEKQLIGEDDLISWAYFCGTPKDNHIPDSRKMLAEKSLGNSE